MKQLFSIVKRIALFIILLIALSCSSEISVSVIVPENRLSKDKIPTQIYLLSTEEYANIENVKTRNGAYFRTKLSSINDSLKVLKSAYNSISSQLSSTSENCSTIIRRLPLEYCSYVAAIPAQIAKYGDVWQLSANINNNGIDDIWGLVLSVKYKDNVIINHKEYSVFLQPNQRFLFSAINFDLSNNLPLQYSMSTYPGGLDKMLEEVLTIKVDSVISMFSASMSDCVTKTARLKQDLENIGITIDVFSEQTTEYLDDAIVKPVNRILVENLRRIEHKSSVTAKDTVLFSGLKKGGYQLLVYSDIDAVSTQYLIPVDLTKSTQATINIGKYPPRLFFLNKDKFLTGIPSLPGQ